MPCYHPITAYRSVSGREKSTGKWPIVFSKRDGYTDLEIKIPCGRCVGCRLERSRQWAIRCVHEAKMHEENCFITLTYNDENVDKNGSLNKRDFVLFMKKLRKKYGEGIRFFHCGEYGEELQRPHHHACIFNFDFPDKQLYTIRQNTRLYRSESLEKLWPYGYSTIGEVTFESAAYVARYVMKKINGAMADEHYNGREPEYVTMSRRPGIGRDYYDKYKGDIYPADNVVIRTGMVVHPPKYYDVIYDQENHLQMERIKYRRKRKALLYAEDNTPERLEVKEKVKNLKIKKLVRPVESLQNENVNICN